MHSLEAVSAETEDLAQHSLIPPANLGCTPILEFINL